MVFVMVLGIVVDGHILRALKRYYIFYKGLMKSDVHSLSIVIRVKDY